MPVERASTGESAGQQQGGSPFIHQLRELYQRSLRARELAQRTQAGAAAAHSGEGRPDPDEPCPMTTDEEDALDDDRTTLQRLRALVGPPPPAAAAAAPAARSRPGGGGAVRAAPAWPLAGELDALFSFRGLGARGGGGAVEEMEGDDEDCPGLIDADEETEEEEEEEDMDGGSAGDLSAMLTWRSMRAAGGRLRAALPRRRTASMQTGSGIAALGGMAGAATPAATGAAPAASAAPALDPSLLRAPQPCSFLRLGARFAGVQRLSSQSRAVSRPQDDWAVDVIVEGVNHDTGAVCGTMQALNVPGAGAAPVVTWWEGHILDDRRHTFFTAGSAGFAGGGSVPGRETDLKHWGRFEGFAQLRPDVVRQGGRSGALERHPWIYMRWKEQFFVGTGQDVGLTIAGFYYLALCRRTGKLRGFYYDPHSSPFQALELEPLLNGGRGKLRPQLAQQQQEQHPQQQEPQQQQQQQQGQQQAQLCSQPIGSGGGYVFTSSWRHG